tara:strand:- start:487 stop:750 length:264 start_codon:yes stop_codon:yes gene_type:complete
MIRELKYLFFLVIIFLFFILTFKYYFSDLNKKNSYRSFKENDKKILIFSKNLILLDSDTNDIVEFIEKTTDKNKKNYNFWSLINNND